MAWRLPVLEFPPGTRLYRLNLNDGDHVDPAYFGENPSGRFNAPDGSYGVCYLGTTLTSCFIETQGISRPDDGGAWFVTASELGCRDAFRVLALRTLRLAYLADDGLQMLGIDLRVTGGDDYILSREWSKAIHRHAARVDGIFYPSRHHNRLFNVALFDRAHDAVEFSLWGTPGDRSNLSLWRATMRFRHRFDVNIIVEPDP